MRKMQEMPNPGGVSDLALQFQLDIVQRHSSKVSCFNQRLVFVSRNGDPDIRT